MMFIKLFYLWVLLPAMVCAEVSIPDAIQVPPGNSPVLSVHAQGEQIYQCSLNGGAYSWQLQAPDARLFDAQGQIIGSHYAGPVWEYKDGSRVVGQVVKQTDIDPGSSISWLLVKVIKHKGKGFFSEVNFINRINTHGGLPPVSKCDSNHLGAEKRVPYTANYIFYEALLASTP